MAQGFANTTLNDVDVVISNDTATNATMFLTWVTANSGSLPLKVTSTKLFYNPSTSLLTNVGPLGQITNIQSSVGAKVLEFSYTASAVNYLAIGNSIDGAPVSIQALGTSSTILLGIGTKGNGAVYINDTDGPGILRFYETGNTNFVSLSSPAVLAADLAFILPAADGAANTPLLTNGSGVLGFTPTSAGTNIIGTTTNGAASAGSVGELITSPFSGTALTTGNNVNLGTLNLTAGEWEIFGNATFIGSSAGVWTSNFLGFSTTSITFGANGTFIGDNSAGFGANSTQGYVMPSTHVRLAGNATYYLVGQCSFTTGTMAAYGDFWARRVR